MNIMSLSFAFGDGLQATAVALIGRSLGAKDPDLGQGIRQNMPSDRCRYRGLPCCDLLFRCKRTLQPLLHRGTHYRDWNQDYACHYLCRYFPGSVRSSIGCLRGAGDTLYTAVASMISVTFIRTFVSYFFGYTLGLGIVGIWMGVLGDRFRDLSLRLSGSGRGNG